MQNQVISHATARPNLPAESVEKGTTPFYTETSPLVKIASCKPEKVDQKKDYTPSTPATANASSVSLTSHVESTVITNSKIVPISVSHRDDPKKEAKVYVLLDDPSDTTFITTKAQQALGIAGVETELTLSTTSGKEVISV